MAESSIRPYRVKTYYSDERVTCRYFDDLDFALVYVDRGLVGIAIGKEVEQFVLGIGWVVYDGDEYAASLEGPNA